MATKSKKKSIVPVEITSFSSGLDQRSEKSASPDSFTFGRNVMVDESNAITYRYGLEPWLPDTVGKVYQVATVLYNGEEYHFVADDGKMKYCQTGDITWTDCGGLNTVTTTGVINTFVRVQNALLILNGEDKSRWVRFSDMTVVQAVHVDDPTNAPTLTASGTLTTTGTAKVYYAMAWNSPTGTTNISPILSQAINKNRSMWKTDGTDYLTVTRNNTAPTGAVSWNLYIATAAAGGTIAATDMLLLAGGLDLGVTTFIDNGAIQIDISQGTAPEDNSTDGFAAKYGIESEGRPILWGIKGDEYAIRIGGDGDNALDFSVANGGYRAVPNEDTNYYPMNVVGFRNNQGTPSITVLFSNTEGLSKQSILEQKTITYGNYTFVVWGTTEQNYGAAGVASPYGVENYNGMLTFMTTGGLAKMDTKTNLPNIISTEFIDAKFKQTVGSIPPRLLEGVVSAAWADKLYYCVPSRGYEYNNQILVYDIVNPDRPKGYIFDIRAQWIGTVSPRNEEAFVYVCQDNHIYRMRKMYATHDEDHNGVLQPFPTSATGTLMGFNDSHSAYAAVVQVVFDVIDILGTVEVGVTYINKAGKPKVKRKKYTHGTYELSTDGNWSSTDYLFNDEVGGTALTWEEIAQMTGVDTAEKKDKRIRIRLNGVITNEVQWFFNTGLASNAATLKSVTYEVMHLGVGADLR